MAQRVRVFIRYFTATDTTPIGLLALEYFKALLRIAPVRPLSVSGAFSGEWARYTQAMATPISGAYVSVVCCHPLQWKWRHNFTIPETNANGVKTQTPCSGEVDLYTPGVRNVLIIPQMPDGPEWRATASRYEARIVPTQELQQRLADAARTCLAYLIPPPQTGHDHDRLRNLVMP